jgi:hypothetical protein
MGNLEKAGVGVVVGLLAVILFVAFVNNGETPGLKLTAERDGEPSSSRVAGIDDEQDSNSATPRNGAGGAAPSVIVPGGDRRAPNERPSDTPPAVEPPNHGRGQTPPTPPAEEERVTPAPTPVPTPTPTPAPAPVADWPKSIKVQKGDGSLIAVVRRAYGVDSKKAYALLPAVMKANPSLKPTAMRVGDEIVMPAPGADAPKKDADAGSSKSSSKGEAAKATPTQKGATEPKTPRRLPFMPPKKR